MRSTNRGALADEVRAATARLSLEQPDVAIAEVGYLLGFSDQSTFNRAFERWTGSTPARSRAMLRGAWGSGASAATGRGSMRPGARCGAPINRPIDLLRRTEAMPIDYRIDHALHLVIAPGNGRLTDRDVFGYQREVWSRTDVGGYNEVVDMRGVEHIEVPTTERIKELASLAAGMDLPGSASKFAIVATDEIAASLGQFFGAYRQLDARSTKEVSTFKSMADAFAWLGVAGHRG